MYVDFAGDCLEVTVANTGEVRSVEVFVAILPCSQYTVGSHAMIYNMENYGNMYTNSLGEFLCLER